MSQPPSGRGQGIFGIIFREVGLFYEQAFKWADDRDKEFRQNLGLSGQSDVEARLIEQVRRAKQAGVDVDKVLKQTR